MELKDIKDLIKVINSSNIKSFEMKNNDNYIKIESCTEKSDKGLSLVTATKEVNDTKKLTSEDKNIIEIKSPIVGTFYSRPAPDKEPFVKVGDMVKKGDTVCIIEAMKLMNDINAEEDGEIIEICVSDGDMVEYGQVLFKQRIK